MRLEYSDLKTIVIAKKLLWQYQESFSPKHVYLLYAYDDVHYYEAVINTTAEIEDFEANYKATANQPLATRNDFGAEIVSPTFDDVNGLYPKKKMYKDTAIAGQINFFDIEVTQEKRINGGEYWVHPEDVAKVHDDDYVEFSIIDKNDVLGLFSAYGLNKANGDILELCKFVLTDYVLKGDPDNGYHSELYEGIKGTNVVYTGLFMRAAYVSHGTENIRWKWRLYFYE